MNSTKLILGLAFVGATVAANAGLTLTVVPAAKSNYYLDGNFMGAAAFPTANSATATSSIVVNPMMMGDGQINGWWLTAVSNAPVGTITYAITLSGINATSTIDYYLHAYSFNPTSGQIGPAHYGAGDVQNLVNIEALTGSMASTQTIDISYNVGNHDTAAYKLNADFYNVGPVPEPASIATMALGVTGLIIRRRRSSK